MLFLMNSRAHRWLPVFQKRKQEEAPEDHIADCSSNSSRSSVIHIAVSTLNPLSRSMVDYCMYDGAIISK